MSEFWHIALRSLAFGYIMQLCFVPLWAPAIYEEVGDPNRRKAYITLAVLWPISLILFAPIILVFAFKYLAIGSNSALGYIVRGVGEVGNIYKEVIKR
jgi:hypothetical protein